jgi:hypothetical protein
MLAPFFYFIYLIFFFTQERHAAAKMSMLLPIFGQAVEEDCMDLESFQAFVGCQTSRLKDAIQQCDLVNTSSLRPRALVA